MLSDRQVGLLRKKMAEGRTIEAAAAAAGMSERSAYVWKGPGPLPSEAKPPRTWRTRADPFVAVWESKVVPLLEADDRGVLGATTVLELLSEQCGDNYKAGQLRTLQRRMHDWRVLHGPGKDVKFEQVHPPGREGAFDFTDCSSLGVTIAGVHFAHLLFEFVLSFSGWRWVMPRVRARRSKRSYTDCRARSGRSAGYRRCGVATTCLPRRTSSLAAGVSSIGDSPPCSITTARSPPGSAPGNPHENGVAEKAHDLLKRDLAQALLVRGSRDFATVPAYEAFVAERVARPRRP